MTTAPVPAGARLGGEMIIRSGGGDGHNMLVQARNTN